MKSASLIVATVFLLSFIPARAEQSSKPKPTRIAVVDIGRVLNTCKEKAQIEARLQTKRDEASRAQTAAQKEIQELQFNLKMLNPDTEAYQKQRDAIAKTLIEHQVHLRFRSEQLIRDQIRQYHGLYTKIQEACGAVAKENGYDLVLHTISRTPKFKTREALLNHIAMRNILWAADNLDITEKVIQNLDTKFQLLLIPLNRLQPLEQLLLPIHLRSRTTFQGQLVLVEVESRSDHTTLAYG